MILAGSGSIGHFSTDSDVRLQDEMVEQIHQAAGGNFRSVDMIIPRILELEQRNRQRLADGTVKMNEIIKVAAARLMI